MQQSDLVTYHEVSPDPLIPGCRNTGMAEDGVTFNVEPMVGTETFIGRTSIIEAVAALYDMSPGQVKDRLTRANTQIKNLTTQNESLTEEHERYRKILDELRGVLEDAFV